MSKPGQELGIALVNRDEMAVFTHQLDDVDILFLVGLVDCLESDLGQAEQLRELISLLLAIFRLKVTVTVRALLLVLGLGLTSLTAQLLLEYCPLATHISG